jgi:uncharacterized protein
MNRNSLLNIFAPKYSTLFPFLDNYTADLVLAAEHLNILLKTDDPGQQIAIAKIINDLRNKGHVSTYEICSLMNRLFITPFNREEIKELVLRVGEVLESINDTGKVIYFYRPVEIYSPYSEIAEIIYQATVEIRNIVDHLSDAIRNRNPIVLSCENLVILERRANVVFYHEIMKLVVTSGIMVQLKQRKNILEMLIKCVREATAVAETTRLIMRKSM